MTKNKIHNIILYFVTVFILVGCGEHKNDEKDDSLGGLSPDAEGIYPAVCSYKVNGFERCLESSQSPKDIKAWCNSRNGEFIKDERCKPKYFARKCIDNSMTSTRIENKNAKKENFKVVIFYKKNDFVFCSGEEIIL